MLPCGIIFDWDNTLVDVQSSLDFALIHTMNEIGSKTLETRSNRNLYFSREKFLQDKFKNNWREVSEIYNKYMKQAPIGEVELFENAKKVLQFTFDNQIPTVIVSNKFGVSLRTEVDQLSLSKYFLSVVGSGDTNEEKPSMIPAKAALKEASIEPSKEVWFIGDGMNDMECARKLGLTRILYGMCNTNDIITDFRVRDHYELLDLFQSRLLV